MAKRGRAREQEGTERESRRTISQNFTAREQETSDGLSPSPTFLFFLSSPAKVEKKGLLLQAAPPRPFSHPKRNITLFHPQNTEVKRVGNFLPIFLRRHESPSEKGPGKGLRLGTRPGTVPTEPIKATTRTEWQLGGRPFSRRGIGAKSEGFPSPLGNTSAAVSE